MAWDFTVDSDIQLDMAKYLKEKADELDTQFANLYTQIGPSNLGTHWVGSDYDAFNVGCEGYKQALDDMTDSVRMYASHFEKVAEGTDLLSSLCISIVQNMTTRGDALPGSGGAVSTTGGTGSSGTGGTTTGTGGNGQGTGGNGTTAVTGGTGQGTGGNGTGTTGQGGTGFRGGSTGQGGTGGNGTTAVTGGTGQGTGGNGTGIAGQGGTGFRGGSTGQGGTGGNGTTVVTGGTGQGTGGNGTGTTGQGTSGNGNQQQSQQNQQQKPGYWQQQGQRYVDDWNDFTGDVSYTWGKADGLISGTYALAETGGETILFVADTAINAVQTGTDMIQSGANWLFDAGDSRSVGNGDYWSNIGKDYAENFDYSTCDNFAEGLGVTLCAVPRTVADIGQTVVNVGADAIELVGDGVSWLGDKVNDGVTWLGNFIFG